MTRRKTWRTSAGAVAGAVLVGALLPAVVVAPSGPAAAADPALPTHASAIAAGRKAASYYQPTYAVSASFPPRNGWSWSTYEQGRLDLAGSIGDDSDLQSVVAWGAQHSWSLTTDVHESDPNPLKAGQVYVAATRLSPSASRTQVDTRMATALTSQRLDKYWFVDALFMGLPSWADAAARTGNTAYLDTMDALFAYVRDRAAGNGACTGTAARTGGLFSVTDGLWYRDCRYVGNPDANGQKVFWSRGNGWAIAAMADVLAALPTGSLRAAPYATMLTAMAAALAPLQRSDGLWGPSLQDPALWPQPETSGTALITYALAYGVRTGLLPAATYLPVIARAWQGLSTVSLQPSGFLRHCQDVGAAPALPYAGTAPRTAPTSSSPGTLHNDSAPFCVGAFLLAASHVARLHPDLALRAPVTATAQQAGNEVTRLVDGSTSTRWSASGFPETATVDLGASRVISDVMVSTYLDRAYRYRIETSPDRLTWTRRVDRTASTTTGTLLDTFTSPVSARWLRVTVTGVSASTTTWAALTGLSAYGP